MYRRVNQIDSQTFSKKPLENYVVLDAETTTHNKGHPFDPRNKLISYAYLSSVDLVRFKYFSDPDFNNQLSHSLCSGPITVCGFNVKFDYHWCSHLLSDQIKIWDCQLAEHIYTGQKAQYISLNECLEKYGLETKKDMVKEMWDAGIQTDEIPIDVLEEYNCWDVIQTEKLFLIQQQLLDDSQKNLVYLLGEDLKVLAHIEAAGLKFDREGASAAVEQYKADVAACEEQLSKWLPDIHHGVFNYDSGDHLSCLLYGGTLNFDWCTETPAVYKTGNKKGQEYVSRSWYVESVLFPGFFKPLNGTEVAKTKDKQVQTRFYQVDAPTLASLKGGGKDGKKIIELLTQRAEKQKVVEMLESIFKQFNDKYWTDNLIHGQLNQNVVVTGRLSSSNPNMQNQPPEVDKFLISRYD